MKIIHFSLAIIKTFHSIIGIDRTAISTTVQWPLTFSYGLLVPSLLIVRRCCSEVSVSVWRTGKASQVVYCFADSKVLWSTDPVLRSFFLRAWSVSVVTKVKMHVGKCTGGEVGGFKHLHVETKQPNSFMDFPRRLECKVRAWSGFYTDLQNLLDDLKDLNCTWG